ncbi:glutamate--tRNA ligase [Candidatus Uhrbacteria bacterium CG_4_9_14_3_um_filter_50_9]|uniref:Glutamate--tRNA ligase n=1 Tax=Candidatus Uhrbacteria bacterium CG_4_9_14_3_um_filter_50_9 TaxID=1975035 RepID=A0A2M7XDU5_9BACT|nr:MAG: glutamate--tRNA ligase [Candidatus Uhrbacteria bacterium CG_4_9_14_3_um_filter_50_9]
MNVKTRFPPSPTGFLHIGSLRTVLYNYLHAKKNQGALVLRVEDTDQARLVDGAIESLIRTLDAVGIAYDEGPILLKDGTLSSKGEQGPYIQSERLEIYKEHAQRLLDEGHAYVCFCSKERLDQVRKEQQLAKLPTKYDRTCLKLGAEEVKERMGAGEPHVVRLKIPEGETTFQDEVRGSITINNSEIDDQVLVKTDGFPTYHLAVVVDDHLMGITHVIRGEEWISSVPKHIILYQAFGFPLPVFAHLPLILNPDRSKLSKRQGDVAVEDFLGKGYLPEALLNFVALLGFNPTGDREIYTLQELEESFELSKVNKGGAVFDQEKLRWMNGQYIKQTDTVRLVEITKQIGVGKEIDRVFMERIMDIEKDRLDVLINLQEQLPMYISQPDYNAELLVWKKADLTDAKTQLEGMRSFLEAQLDAFFEDRSLIEEGIKGYINDKELQNGNVLWPLRVALSGAGKSPGPFELLWVFGKQESIQRIKNALNKLS